MKVVNPLNRVPLSNETIVSAGCHCVCSSGQSGSYTAAWLPFTANCKCQCNGDTTNNNFNFNKAYNNA